MKETYYIRVDLTRQGANINQTKKMLKDYFDTYYEPTLDIGLDEVSLKLHKISVYRLITKKGKLV